MDQDSKHTETGTDHQLIERTEHYTDTPTSRKIMMTLDFAKSSGIIATVAGTPGVGKTMTLKYYAAMFPSTWYCQFSKDTASVFATLVEVALAVGISELPNRPDEIRRAIGERMKGALGLLICDEAQHLSPAGFELIRTLHDRIGIGVVFAGHLDLMDKVARLPQLAGRVSAPVRIGAALAADVDALFNDWGFACKRSRGFLRQFAGQSTGLRRIANAFKLATVYAAADQAPVGFNHIQQAWEALSGSVSAQ